MIVIREAQMRAFRQAMEDGFRFRAMEHLRSRYPGRTENHSDEQLQLVVDGGLREGRGFGFDTEKNAIIFIELTMIYGPDFHKRGEAAEILSANDTCAARLEALHAAGYRH